MTLSRVLILTALTATVFSTMTVEAKEIVVGDDIGWTTWFNYLEWARNKVFRVGDTLLFNYPPGKDNVISVNRTDFINCIVPLTAQPLTSGHDIILLTSPGKRGFISGVDHHCQMFQKLVINVLPQEGLAPAPEPSVPWKNENVPHFGGLKKLFKKFH